MANGLFKSSNASAGALSSAQVANSTDIKTASLFNSQQKQVEEQRKIIDEYYAAQNAPKDNGGFFGGIGYAFEKLGLGFLQSIEGIWDYTAGGLADLFGAHDWAEKQIANDWVNYGHADEWFNPSDGWKVAGDVAGGIGTSLPAISAVLIAVGTTAAVTFFSGGTLTPVVTPLAAGLIGGAVAGLGAAGTATKEAYKETGQLTGKEWGYGTLSGFTEGAMEGVSDAIGFGVGSIVKNLAGSTAKEGAKQVGKQIAKSAARQTFGKTVLKSFLSEAFEEGVQELIDPVWKRLTYDPNAENATFQQVAYAALVGGLSGAIMSGADVSIRNSINYFSGSKTTANGGAQGVIDLATTIAETEGVNQSGNAQVDFVVNTLSELQESLKTTNGEVKTAKQKMLVGILSKANTAAPLSIVVHQNADAIIADAETTVKRLNDIGYKTSKGEAVTVEMLKQGVTGERGTTEYRRSLSQAMKTNEALRSVAVMSAAGQLNMDAARFQQSTLRGEQLFNQSDLNHFVETATEQQKRDVGERLDIADWATVTADELKSRIVEFSTNGGLDQYINERNEVKKLTELEISKKGLPKYVGSIKQDGAVRYKFGDASVAIVKNGDTYLVYDYANDIASKPLTKTEANRVIKEIYAASVQSATDSDVQTKAQQETQQLDAFARENVPDYKNLVGAQQQAVRQTLRQAKAAGVSEADQILYASVAARSGVNIEFVSAETLGANADAGYSLKNGKILVNREMANNPKSRTAAKILLHEFTHGMIHRGYSVKGKKGNQHIENKVLNDFFTTAIKGLSTEQQIEILKPYVERHGVKMQDFLDGKVDLSVDTYIELREELAAHFVERELGNSAALKRIISDKPSFKDKLLSFLKRSKSDYSSNEKLSRAANALLKKYQAFFNKYATQNRFSPTITGDTSAYQTTEAADAQTRLSIKKINGKDVVVIDTDQHIFDGVERAAMGKTVRSYMKERYRGRSVNGTAFTAQSEREYTHSRDSQRLYNQTDGAYEAKMRASTELNNIIQTGELIGQETAKHPQTINEGGVKRYKVSFVLDGKAFNGEMIIAIDKSGVETFYDVVKIKESESSNNAPDGAVRTNAPSTDIISSNEENVNPDGKKSGKKRYALTVDGENITGEVEQTKNLVALHNLSETSLLKVLQLGGFPMPSIAITKVDMGHSEYGDITVVFGRDTIDPQKDRRNKIYSRDGWTPTAPKVEYKPNDRALSKIHKKYSELVSKVGYDATRVLYNYVNDIERQLELHGGEIGIISELYDNTELMNLFLVDTGGELIKPIYKTIRSELSAGEVTYRKRLIDALGKDFLAEFEKTSGNLNTRKDFVKQHKERIVNALATIMQGKESIEETRENISNNFSVFALGNTLDKATSYLNNGGISVSTEYDATATQEAIRKATSKREYVSWVDKLFGGIEEKTGIYNGRDPYTNSGNRRSFEALHYEYTLENMVEAMLNAPENGGSGWHGLTLGQLQAKLAKEFKSIDEIRLNADNLTVKDEAAHEEFSENTRKMLSEITALMVDESKYGSDSVAYWTALDSAEMVVGEIADNRLFTLEKIAAYMKREYSKSYRYNDSIGNKILGLFEYVRRENSTDYFEAKPRRAVAFSEIKKVLIPETASEKLIKQLTARNIPYQVYDSSDNARTNAIKQMDDVRFALPETDSQGHTLTAEQRAFFKDSKVVDDKGRLLVVYHGTNDVEVKETWNAERRSFDMEYSPFTIFKKKWEGQAGHFFGKDIDNAGGYGSRIYKCYLNIKNPLVIECNNRDYSVIEYNGQIKDTYEWAEYAKAKGYDGVIFKNIRDGVDYGAMQQSTDEYVVFQSNQIKNTDNTSPTWLADIRYAINPEPNPDANPTESDNSGAIGGLTRGQRAKFVANNTKFKVYSKLDATSVIDSIIAERLTLRDGQYEGVLSGKNRAEVIEKLFTKLNSTPEGYRIGVALDIADYIINNAVLSDMYETYNDDSYAMGVLSVMRRYMHGVNLSGIQSEIQYKFDRKNSINLVWGAKMGGQSPDVIAQELEGYGIHIEAINEAEQFFEMLELYERAREQVNQKAEKIMLTAIGSKTEIEQLRQEIARDVLLAYDKKGTPSKYAKLVEQYTKKIADLKKDLSTAYKRNTLTNRIIDGAAYLRDIANKRNYVGAEIFAAPELTQWLKQLSKIKYRSDLRKTGVRKILLDYGQFYTKDNSLLYDEKNPEFNYIDNNVIDALNFIRQNALSTKPLSMEELQAAEIIIASAKHLFNNYDQIIIEGKKAKISELATEGNEIIKKSKNRTNKTFFNKIYGAFNKIIEPRVVIKSLENFNPNGILTRAYAEVTRGETEAGLLYIELTNDIDTYIKKHKRFKNRLTSEYITVAGAELTVGQAISLYELSKRTQAQEGLYESGFSYIDKKGSKQTAHITEADITAMYDAFTDTDKGFIELVETFFNVASKQVKTDADMQILGYTNASDEFYYPIKRDSGTIVKNITDARSIMADWANVYNFSFNKDVKTGAKNKLFVTDVYSIVTRHAKQLSTYAKMTVPLKNFSQIYAKNIGEKTNVVSIRNTINEQVWGGAEGYLSKLFSDIQGRATSNSIIEKMRGAYAKYQLGANLKVIVSQITSYPTAGIMLDSGVMAKGFVMKTNWAAMDKYCPYARVRNFERGIVRAEGVVDKIGKVGDVLTKPIQWTDRFTIGRLWNACQLQVQKDTGLKYGTVENMQKAGDMLEEVIRLTQPNYTNTERSELMRSDSDIVRSFTMFTSVPLKQLSRLVESFGEYNALRSLIKSGDSDPTLSKRYKLAKKKIRRTLAAVTIANLMYVLVGQFFKFLYNNMAEDDEEGKVTAKSFFLDMLKDFGSTTIGMLPVVRDIYGYFVNGYEIESFTGDMLNSIISSAKSLFELATKAASGEEIKTQEYMSIFRNSLYSIGQVTGIPVRNINNTITGLVRRFSPSAAYAYTSLFYNPKYSTDIKAALKKGDYELAEMIMGMLLKDDRTGSLSSKATQKFIELYDAGYTVLPKSIGNTLTYNGETIQLTAAQQSAFKTIYSQANAEIEKLVNSAEFATLSAERQAKAIKLLYDAYYSKAQSSVLKLANDNKIILLSGAISPSTLAPHLSAISAIESDTDKAGNVINGSKKAKVIKYVLAQKLSTPQKLLLILSLGYTIKDGDIRGVTALKAKRVVARYITSLALSREEKTALAEKCGLTVKNGRIYAK